MLLSAQHLAEIVETINKPVAGKKGGGSDKRRSARHSVVTKVDVLHPATGRTYTALTRDLSMEGIGLVQSTSMAKDDELAISLPRGKQAALVALCKVMHTREMAAGLWAIGAIFVRADAHGLAAAASRGDLDEAQRIAAKMLE